MKIIDCVQGSEEWFTARLGKVTGTGFAKVLAKGQGKTRKSYMIQLAAERLTGLAQESYSNAAMEWGTEHEADARIRYEMVNDVSVLLAGFVELSDEIGTSPDGLVDDEGLLEIKCPNSTTHIETIMSNNVPSQYIPQIQGGMWVAERQWCDFVSFDPRVTSMPYLCLRVARDQKYIDNLENEVNVFVAELKGLTEKITGLSPY